MDGEREGVDANDLALSLARSATDCIVLTSRSTIAMREREKGGGRRKAREEKQEAIYAIA